MKNIEKLDMTKFRKMGLNDSGKPEYINQLADYIEKYIEGHKDDKIKIFIGTDSQNTRKRRITTYATVICLYREGKGGHIIYNKHRRNDVKDRFNRLWWEVEYSMQVANFLKDKNVYLKQNLFEIHIDLSPNIKHGSHSVYNSAKGYIMGSGYEIHAKPEAIVASYAADMVCRG